ncbi:hypothetical protein ACTFIW_011709 [Dictyostelium discoideum]
MLELKITLVNEDGESTISGKAYPLPAPLIYPPVLFFCFIQYKTEGTLWDKNDFQIKSGKIEFKGEEFDIPSSHGSWSEVEDQIDIRIHPTQPPNKPFIINFY